MLTRTEQETVIRFDEQEQTADVFTSSKRVADKLRRCGLEPYRATIEADAKGWFFKVSSYSVILKPGRSSIRLGIRSTAVEQGKKGNHEG